MTPGFVTTIHASKKTSFLNAIEKVIHGPRNKGDWPGGVGPKAVIAPIWGVINVVNAVGIKAAQIRQTPMFDLFSILENLLGWSSKSVEEKIAVIQRKSMERHIESVGENYESQIGRMLDSINQQHQDPASPTGFRVNNSDLSFPLKTEQDFWRYRELDALDTGSYAGRLVERASASGNLKPFSLKTQRLADRLSETLKQKIDSNSISAVIEAIPVLHLAEPEFHAAASVDYDRLGAPYIRHYYTTLRSLQILAQVLLMNTMVFVPDQKRLMLRSKAEYFYDRLTDDTPVLASICEILNSLEQKTGWFSGDLPAYSRTATADEWPVKEIGIDVSLGAKLMLWLHEIGHHLLDHFDSRSSKLDKETEADRFAIACLLAAEGDRAGYHLIGAEIPFILLPMFPSNSDYPAPADRASLVREAREQAFPSLAPVLQYPLVPLYVAASIWEILDRSQLMGEIVYPLISQLGDMKVFAENAPDDVRKI